MVFALRGDGSVGSTVTKLISRAEGGGHDGVGEIVVPETLTLGGDGV